MSTATLPPSSDGGSAPEAPHDDLTFDELADRYNFEQTSKEARVLTRLIMKELRRRQRHVRVLDVGCGSGIGRRVEDQWEVRQLADDYWGVEPDESKVPPQGLFDHHVAASLQKAELPPNSFDVIYSCMVMEHVEDPDSFMQMIHRSLKPGGVYLFITPNRRHYFTRIAATLRRLRLDELVLALLKGKAVDEYHYPVQYRFNDEKRIDGCAERLGFLPPRYVYLESVGPRPYFPRPLRFIFRLLAAKRRIIRKPRNLLVLLGRLEKPAVAAEATATA
jgi:SAM-dependent methyltransferase